MIAPDKLTHKYKNEIHANELVLLAYYIAAINIEAVYHGLAGGEYEPFKGICLTDTFQMYEQDDQIQDKLAENSHRRMRQKGLNDIRVIIGNPPYSVGQDSANDNNQNHQYPKLDTAIRTSYAAMSTATNKNALYDSYIRAFRWASNRIGDKGVIGFVTNGGYLEASTTDGMRRVLANEFSNIYIFHLRGNQRTQGEQSRKEGGKIFGSGSRSPIAISILVKNPDAEKHGQIFFHDIGDYLSREDKLNIVDDLRSIDGISAENKWRQLIPDEYGDWLNQRDASFDAFIQMGSKKNNNAAVIFANYSRGIETGRDAWCYNSSKDTLQKNLIKTINVYNSEIEKVSELNTAPSVKDIVKFLNNDPQKISWTSSLYPKILNKVYSTFNGDRTVVSLYRPYNKQWLYFDSLMNHRTGQMKTIFPVKSAKNLLICVSGLGAKNFSTLITDTPPCLDNIEKGQCFPLYLYDEDGSNRRNAITDAGLRHFTSFYASDDISREDVFYYIYGLLHSNDLLSRYADNLSKELPRIPRVKKVEDFHAFRQAGRDLAELHLNYENIPMFPAKVESSAIEDSDYRILKMKHPKVKVDGKSVDDLSTVVVNNRITVSNIPAEAYEYVVNGKSAIKWVMERQQVKTDKASGIVNDPNDWAVETMENAKYPLELLLRVITVSVETMKIVKSLPRLQTETDD